MIKPSNPYFHKLQTFSQTTNDVDYTAKPVGTMYGQKGWGTGEGKHSGSGVKQGVLTMRRG